MNQFEKDYEQSRKQEIRLEEYLNHLDQYTENSSKKGYFPDWDISSTSTTTGSIATYELKYNNDYATNNVVIENCRIIDQQKHPSGLTSTKADYYVLAFENDSNFYLIPTQKLKDLVNSNKTPKRILTDKNGYQLYIFSKDYLLPLCNVL